MCNALNISVIDQLLSFILMLSIWVNFTIVKHMLLAFFIVTAQTSQVDYKWREDLTAASMHFQRYLVFKTFNV